MALIVQNLKREFKFSKGGKTILLDDPNPAFIPDDVMSFYSATHPELTTSTVSGPEILNDKAIYEFKTTVGTKG